MYGWVHIHQSVTSTEFTELIHRTLHRFAFLRGKIDIQQGYTAVVYTCDGRLDV